ncbi:MAG: hypothetical protein UR26_C0001G0086 [candidate division TM6 bacterium GW2011_GWF2_32_72]|nr:MAG: hypothetical protein UR26_C0001G0086 [candidate division TM6 bacterium GW2011_GWF2_32_72]
MNHKFFSFVLLISSLFFPATIFPRYLLLSDKENTQTSFAFKIGPSHYFNGPSSTAIDKGGTFFVGADEAVLDEKQKQFSISFISNDNTEFSGMAREKVRLNGAEEQLNPLYGAAVLFINSISDNQPIVVLQNDKKVYLAQYLSGNTIYSSSDINDAAGVVANTIHSLVAAPSIKSAFFGVSAVGGFGEAGSGIAAVLVNDNGSIGNLNATTGSKTENQAAAFGKTSAALSTGSNLNSLEYGDMYWDNDLGRLYVCGIADLPSGSGAGIAMANVSGGLSFSPIVSDLNILTDADKIVGATDANIISIYKVRTMKTSTYLKYLVLVGRVGENTNNKVFALPVVDKRVTVGSNLGASTGDPDNGKLANVNANPVNYYLSDSNRFITRGFSDLATAADQLYKHNDIQAMVGAGDAPGAINDIFIVEDGVFISCEDGETDAAGIFSSQPIFDGRGVIASWSKWKRVAGFSEKINAVALEQKYGNFVVMPYSDVTRNGASTQNVYRTKWGSLDTTNGMGLLLGELHIEYPQKNGGIQGFFDFSKYTQGFTDPSLEGSLSLAVATGYEKISIIQTGKSEDGTIFYPVVGNDFLTDKFVSNNGSLSGLDASLRSLITVSGGQLEKIGSIVAAEVSRCAAGTNSGWIFVGGSDGLAVLSKDNGAGWNTLSAGLQGFTIDMSFKRLGNYKNVRSLKSDGTYLYVLTDQTLDRIEMIPANFVGTMPTRVTLATPENLGLDSYASFSDVCILGKLGLIATSRGLFRVANDSDIADQDLTSNELEWVQILLPESLGTDSNGCITRLKFLSSFNGITNGTSEFSCEGQVFVMNANITYHQSRIYRLYVKSTAYDEIENTTVQLLPDQFIKDVNTHFINFQDYRNYFTTDGAMYYNMRSRYLSTAPFVNVLPRGVRAGVPGIASAGVNIPSYLGEYLRMGDLVRSSGSGAWVTSGDFGLLVND